MKDKKLPEILKCIHCGNEGLNLKHDGNHLVCSNCNSEYPVSENVPVLLPAKENTVLGKSEIHEKLGTEFNYIDHYQKDAFESDYFEERDAGTEHGDKRVWQYIASEIQGNEGLILDVGCGKAWVAGLFCPKGFEVISMDISLRNTSKALTIYPFKNHHAVVADVFSLPFTHNTFDYIIASEIIEHVQDPKTFIEKLFYTLNPGGKLIVTTPYKEKLRYSLCIHCNKPTPMHAHIHSFDEKILTSLYSGSGLKSVHFKTFISKIQVHFRLHVLFKYLNFSWWKNLDKLMNRIYHSPTRIMVVWEKLGLKN